MENQHVVPRSHEKWAVKTEGKTKAARVLNTQEEAVNYALNRAMKERSCAYTHSKDAVIREVNCFY
jgi:hypothetical protein